MTEPLRRFLFTQSAIGASGGRTVYVDAHSLLDAQRQLARHGANPYRDSSHVNAWSEFRYVGETSTCDQGQHPLRDDLVSPEDLVAFADQCPGALDEQGRRRRTAAALTARAMEEAVDLALAHGAHPAAILMRVTDALAEQALKRSHERGATLLPSQASQAPDRNQMSEKLAALSATVKEIAHLAGIKLRAAETEYWHRLRHRPREAFHTDADGVTRPIRGFAQVQSAARDVPLMGGLQRPSASEVSAIWLERSPSS